MLSTSKSYHGIDPGNGRLGGQSQNVKAHPHLGALSRSGCRGLGSGRHTPAMAEQQPTEKQAPVTWHLVLVIRAAIRKCHGPGGLRTAESCFSQSWSWGTRTLAVHDQGGSRVGGGPLPGPRLLAVSSRSRWATAPPGVSSKDTSPIVGLHPHGLVTFQGPHS